MTGGRLQFCSTLAFGPKGLASQLGVKEYARERKFRERVRRWLELAISIGQIALPSLPNGAFLELQPRVSLHPQNPA